MSPVGDDTIVVCVDASDTSIHAVKAGLELLGANPRILVVTVIDESDPSLVLGGGFAGGVMSPEEHEMFDMSRATAGREITDRAAEAIGVDQAETRVLTGKPGVALCEFATTLPARALIMGSRGQGGIKRAVLGSVSDYVIRNAPCPVIITGPAG